MISSNAYMMKFTPVLDKKGAEKMNRQLLTRFKKLSKKFGGVLKGVASRARGLIAGAFAAGLGAMLTNPLEELNEKLNAILKKGQSLTARAQTLGVSAGELYEASQVAKSAGIEEEDFSAMITALAVKLGEAKSGEDPLLREFLGEENILKSFFNVIESLKVQTPEERARVGAKIFGEGDIVKMADLFSTSFEKRRAELFAGRSTGETTKLLESLSSKEDLQAIANVQREIKELYGVSSKITGQTINVQKQVADAQSAQTIAKFNQYEAFASMKDAQEEATQALDELKAEVVPLLQSAVGLLQDGMRYFRKIKNKFGIGD